MELAKMTSKGQLTVPVSIRKKLGIGAGDQLLFYEREGQIILAPVTPASLAAAQAAAAQQHVYSLEEIREIAVPIAQRHQLKRLTLFGSYARGEATAQSDLDFRADVPADFGMFRLSALQGDLEDAFHKKVDLITEGMLSDPLSGKLARNIEEDEVVLYGVGKLGTTGWESPAAYFPLLRRRYGCGEADRKRSPLYGQPIPGTISLLHWIK